METWNDRIDASIQRIENQLNIITKKANAFHEIDNTQMSYCLNVINKCISEELVTIKMTMNDHMGDHMDNDIDLKPMYVNDFINDYMSLREKDESINKIICDLRITKKGVLLILVDDDIGNKSVSIDDLNINDFNLPKKLIYIYQI